MSEETNAQHLQAVRASLIKQRQDLNDQRVELDKAISALDMLLHSSLIEGGTSTKGSPTLRVVPDPEHEHRSGAPSAHGAILRVLADGEQHSVSALLNEVWTLGCTAQEQSIRSMLGKMKKDGEIANPTRGYYALPAGGQEALTAD